MKRSQTSPNKTAPAIDNPSAAPLPGHSTGFNFPSYLRVSGIFAKHFLRELRRGRRWYDICTARRFSPEQASVAIV